VSFIDESHTVSANKSSWISIFSYIYSTNVCL